MVNVKILHFVTEIIHWIKIQISFTNIIWRHPILVKANEQFYSVPCLIIVFQFSALHRIKITNDVLIRQYMYLNGKYFNGTTNV